MNPQTPARKPRSDCHLKNLSALEQEAIADYGLTHSVTATRDWIVQEYKLRPGRTAVGEFLSWTRTIDQRWQNRGAVRALAAPLESDEPDLTPEELERLAKKHFAESVIEKSDLMAWHRAQRIAIRQEELRLQRDELELKRKMFECRTAEWAVMTFTNPKLKSIAQNGKKTYAERIDEARAFMFGEEQQLESVESLNGGTVESGKQSAGSNIQHSTLNAQHSIGENGAEVNSQHPTSNIQHPIEGGKGGTESKSEERRAKSDSNQNIQHSTLNAQHSGNEEQTPTSKHQTPNNLQTSNANEGAGKVEEKERRALLCESANGNAQSNALRSDPQPTQQPQLNPAAGSMSPSDAQSFTENLYHKVRRNCFGIIINRWDLAALAACLSGQPAKWHSSMSWDLETMDPPAIDPRLDPESPWSDAWKEYVKGALQ